jgi:hypothetical protein
VRGTLFLLVPAAAAKLCGLITRDNTGYIMHAIFVWDNFRSDRAEINREDIKCAPLVFRTVVTDDPDREKERKREKDREREKK